MEIPGLQSAWNSLLAAWPYDDRLFFTVGSYICHQGTFWGLNGILYFIYRFGWFSKYKIQPAQKWPDRALVWACIKDRLLNTLLEPVGIYLLFRPFTSFGLDIHAPLPSVWTFLGSALLFFLINDFLFYWAHRLLHHPALYGRIHKQHHLFKQSVGLAAEYAHPIEQVLANSLPTLAGPLFLHTHIAVFWFYLVIRVWETVDAHCGFAFPWVPFNKIPIIGGGPERHDWHHSHNMGNYGLFSIWDWLCGTDKAYRRWQAEGRRYPGDGKDN